MAFVVPDEIEQYIHQHTASLGELFDALAEETRETLPLPQMQVGRVEGQLLRMLIQLSGAARVLEIGTYSGYSALAMASALPAEGHLITCDIDPVATQVAQRYFDKAPWGSKIELRLGPAVDTMRDLVRADGEGKLEQHLNTNNFFGGGCIIQSSFETHCVLSNFLTQRICTDLRCVRLQTLLDQSRKQWRSH